MKPVFIEATTIQDAYFQLLYKILDHGIKYEITEGSMKGDFRFEFPFASGWINYPHVLPLAPIMPEGIAPTTTDEKIHEYFVDDLMDPDLRTNEHYKYAEWINSTKHYNEYIYAKGKQIEGFSLFNLPGFEMIFNEETPIQWVIRHFQEKGMGNNHCYINVGNSDSEFAYDIPYTNESDRKTSPCLRGIDFKVKDNKLILSVIFRSWGLYSGFPQNLGGMALLNQHVAHNIGVEPGPLAFTSSGLHCYGSEVKAVMIATHKD